MSNEPAEAVWYCVVVRDPATKQYKHYRCLWNLQGAETYKMQLEQWADRSDPVTSIVTIETVPAGEFPKKIL